MAIKGLSKLVVGKYKYADGTVTYTDAQVVEKMVSYSLTINSSDNTPLYGDNAIAENDKGTFKSGELTLGTTDLTQETSLLILGTKQKEATIGSGKVTEQIFDDDAKAPDLGIGLIEWHQVNNIDKYRAVFFHKVFFANAQQSATTKGETVEWQTPTISGTIQRSEEVNESVKHPWMTDAWFDTEDAALAYLKHKCGAAAGGV